MAPMTQNNPNVFNILLSISGYLSLKRKRQFKALLCLMLSSALFELLTLGSIIPFLSIISTPNSPPLQFLPRDILGLEGIGHKNMIILASLLFMIVVLITSAVRLANLWFNNRMAAVVGLDLGYKSYKNLLHQPYEKHLMRNSSDMAAILTTQLSRSVIAINAFLQMITSTLLATTIFIGLIILDWKIAFSCALIIITVYILIAFSAKNLLKFNSKMIASSSQLLMKASMRDWDLKGYNFKFWI